MSVSTQPAGDAHHPGGVVFWSAVMVGWSVIVGAVVLADDSPWLHGRRLELATWLAGTLLVHDLVLAPVVLVVGLLLARLLPEVARGPVLGALAVSALVVLFAAPLWRGYGRRAANPTILPLDYPRHTVLVVLAVWVVAAVAVAVRRVRGRHR